MYMKEQRGGQVSLSTHGITTLLPVRAKNEKAKDEEDSHPTVVGPTKRSSHVSSEMAAARFPGETEKEARARLDLAPKPTWHPHGTRQGGCLYLYSQYFF